MATCKSWRPLEPVCDPMTILPHNATHHDSFRLLQNDKTRDQMFSFDGLGQAARYFAPSHQQQQHYQQQQLYPNSYDRRTATTSFQKFPQRFQSRPSAMNGPSRPGGSSCPVFHYSKRFPNMCMSLSFYDEMMGIVEPYFEDLFQKHWKNLSFQVLPPSRYQVIPWANKPVEPKVEILQPKQNTINSFVNRNNHNNENDFLRDFSSNHTFNVSNKLPSVCLQTPSTSDSHSASTSPLDFEEPVTPDKIISKNDKDIKKLSEENNNKIFSIENKNCRNGSVSSDSSRSDSTDEKTVSYAEIIKHSKTPIMKQSLKPELELVHDFKKVDPIKSNRIPPSKKASITLPNAPFLSNNQHCAFCKNNGEEETVYRTHLVKDEFGNVKCPYLSIYTCPHCKATGFKAHTISRCPLIAKNKNNKLKSSSDK